MPDADGRGTRPAQYSTALIALHWLMAVLIALVFAAIEFREFFERGSATREALKSLHYMLGLTVLALVVVRIVVRRQEKAPRIVPPLHPTLAMAARAMHLALYAIMIAMPVVGYLILSAEGKWIPFFGLSLPPLLGENKDFAHVLEEIHEVAGTLFYILIGLHTIAALYHHYVVRDNTLVRIVPKREARETA